MLDQNHAPIHTNRGEHMKENNVEAWKNLRGKLVSWESLNCKKLWRTNPEEPGWCLQTARQDAMYRGDPYIPAAHELFMVVELLEHETSYEESLLNVLLLSSERGYAVLRIPFTHCIPSPVVE